MTKFQILTDCCATQIQITVLHTNVVTTICIVLNREWRCQTLTQHIQFFHQNLNIASRHLRVLALTFTDLTLHLNTEFTSEFIGTITKRGVISLIENQLCNTIAVTEIDESHTTHLATALHPTCKCYHAASI